ncbi:peptide deformylase [Siminovitchia fortis]|uniref:Peptide deformylase n=1 Tax=Siminovitchia fortis TaxID=254758 RepID=A0A443J107_9BACI|nr:peptide deformylase [Siminovitchia fortis]RWR14080.1 peptide deformylase [Siminovitchia fortis]WHY83349.1 peptide deformylase [Siminovitchia fortis]
MSILQIVHHPNEILETVCEQVKSFDKNLHRLLDNMYDTMVAEDGVGLAAPQIGIISQIAIVDIGEGEESERFELINPEIIGQKGTQIDIEGCLSFPGIYGKVPRAQLVIIKANDRYGDEFTLEAEGYLARAIQHEIDHLNGVLFTSKVVEYVDESELGDWSEEQLQR